MRNFGFVEPAIEPDHYISLGAVGEVIRPDSNWEDFLPVYEAQAEKYETYGCTTFGATNQIEILLKCLYNL